MTVTTADADAAFDPDGAWLRGFDSRFVSGAAAADANVAFVPRRRAMAAFTGAMASRRCTVTGGAILSDRAAATCAPGGATILTAICSSITMTA